MCQQHRSGFISGWRVIHKMPKRKPIKWEYMSNKSLTIDRLGVKYDIKDGGGDFISPLRETLPAIVHTILDTNINKEVRKGKRTFGLQIKF